MKGSRIVSRPPRQARSGVTYKESDDDEEEFVPNARLPSADALCRRSSLRNSVGEVEELGIAKGKRTLTLKRARTVVSSALTAVVPVTPVFHSSWVPSKEPPVTVGKEDVHFHTIQDEEKPALTPDHGRQIPHVVDSAQGVPNSLRESSAFEYLLEAVSGASADGEDEGASVGKCFSSPKKAGQSEIRNDQEEEMTSTVYGTELNAGYATYERKVLAVKGVKSEDTEGTNALRRYTHCSDEESSLVNSSVGKGMKNTVESERDKKITQEGISSADEKKYSRRGERDKQRSTSSSDGKKVSKKMAEERQESMACVHGKKDGKKSEEDMQNGVPHTLGKKDRKCDEEKLDDVFSAGEDEEDDEEEDEDSWNESLDASDAENKEPVKGKRNNPSPAKKPSPELKTFVKKTKVTKKDPGTPGRVLLPAKSTSGPPLLPKKRPGLWTGTKPFVPPGPVNLQSPIVAHRRVVGLSRRHRPPPLHPYLLGS